MGEVHLDEGDTARIEGTLSFNGSAPPSIMEEVSDGKNVGISMYVDGNWDAPEDGSHIEASGYFVKRDYFMEFHVSPENIVVY